MSYNKMLFKNLKLLDLNKIKFQLPKNIHGVNQNFKLCHISVYREHKLSLCCRILITVLMTFVTTAALFVIISVTTYHTTNLFEKMPHGIPISFRPIIIIFITVIIVIMNIIIIIIIILIFFILSE